MLPGDLIEWLYQRDRRAVPPTEQLWSEPMQQWVPIGGRMLLVSIDDKQISWLHSTGLYFADITDTLTTQSATTNGCVSTHVVASHVFECK